MKKIEVLADGFRQVSVKDNVEKTSRYNERGELVKKVKKNKNQETIETYFHDGKEEVTLIDGNMTQFSKYSGKSLVKTISFHEGLASLYNEFHLNGKVKVKCTLRRGELVNDYSELNETGQVVKSIKDVKGKFDIKTMGLLIEDSCRYITSLYETGQVKERISVVNDIVTCIDDKPSRVKYDLEGRIIYKEWITRGEGLPKKIRYEY